MTAPAQDVTGVFDEDFKQLFPDARAMKADVTRISKPMEHPLETGATVVDHRVIQPIEIALLMFLPNDEYKNIYAQIATAFNAGTVMTVQTKVDSFPSMFIAEMPHEETPEFMSLVQVIVKLKEVRFFKTQFEAVTPRQSSAKPTVKRGEQAAKPVEGPPAKKASVAYNLFNKK